MSYAMLFNESSATLPLAFATPTPSPNTFRLRKRRRGVNEPPPLLKRKRTPPSSFGADTGASYLPTYTNLPFLDCENFGTGLEAPSKSSNQSVALPTISLHPRTKRSRIGCFVSSSPQEHKYEQQDMEEQHEDNRNNIETQPRSFSNIPQIEENDDDTIRTADADFSNSLKRSSSSRSMLSRSSMNLTRSLSLQFNMSLLNLAAVAKGGSDSCPLSASTSTLMPKRKSLLQMTSSSSAKDIIQIQEENAANHRRSPVTTTLDYFATAIRLPDVGIGLSI